MDDVAVTPDTAGGSWTCGACGFANAGGATCDRCGVARRWLEDPPLDLPPRPGWFERPATWLTLLHAAGALVGAALWARPELAPWLALGGPAQGIQVALSVAATVAALNRAVTERAFHDVSLETPPRAAAGATIVADARIVPYARTDGVHVTLELIENTYRRSRGDRGQTNVRTRTRRLARHRMVEGGALPGRRASLFEATFLAPYPSPELTDALAEIQASALAAFAWLVPGLGQAARNLREHGGVWVRLTVRVGPFRRRVERRVVVYQLFGDGIAIG